jgi:predicted membrane chloride channel (bestrophin family)
MLSSSLHGLTAAVAMWLAFVPNARYTRWIRARAAA